ncbi:MAG: hypothetical protein ACYCXN_08340 [Acidimicrobiales bacterium]
MRNIASPLASRTSHDVEDFEQEIIDQEPLVRSWWLATTSGYIHVRDDHVEAAWTAANRRLESRFEEGG